MSYQDVTKQRKHERETEAYKHFLVIAKRMQRIEYDKKWTITPDASDPLRKFTLERDTPWFKLQVVLESQEFYHRGDYTDNRYDYKFFVAFTGFFTDSAGPIVLRSHMQVKPRMVKKLISCINEKLIPNLYSEILRHDEVWNRKHDQEKYFQSQLLKLNINKPLIRSTENANIKDSLKGCPLNVTVGPEKVTIDGEITYSQLEAIAKNCGWVK